jgi:hypothetical protein
MSAAFAANLIKSPDSRSLESSETGDDRKSIRPFPGRNKNSVAVQRQLRRAFGRRYFPRKSLKRAQLNDVVRRQDRANQISLRRGVNLIQMTLRFGSRHRPLNALVEGAFDDHVGTRAEGGADALLVERREAPLFAAHNPQHARVGDDEAVCMIFPRVTRGHQTLLNRESDFAYRTRIANLLQSAKFLVGKLVGSGATPP